MIGFLFRQSWKARTSGDVFLLQERASFFWLISEQQTNERTDDDAFPLSLVGERPFVFFLGANFYRVKSRKHPPDHAEGLKTRYRMVEPSMSCLVLFFSVIGGCFS